MEKEFLGPIKMPCNQLALPNQHFGVVQLLAHGYSYADSLMENAQDREADAAPVHLACVSDPEGRVGN